MRPFLFQILQFCNHFQLTNCSLFTTSFFATSVPHQYLHPSLPSLFSHSLLFWFLAQKCSNNSYLCHIAIQAWPIINLTLILIQFLQSNVSATFSSFLYPCLLIRYCKNVVLTKEHYISTATCNNTIQQYQYRNTIAAVSNGNSIGEISMSFSKHSAVNEYCLSGHEKSQHILIWC